MYIDIHEHARHALFIAYDPLLSHSTHSFQIVSFQTIFQVRKPKKRTLKPRRGADEDFLFPFVISVNFSKGLEIIFERADMSLRCVVVMGYSAQ